MKKSNKLLLGGFLTVLVITAGIHIALYAKYKNGNYTVYQREMKDENNGRIKDKNGNYPGQREINEENSNLVYFPDVSHVTINNVRSATVQFGDTASVKKDGEDLIQYQQKGDSLYITGHSFIDNNSDDRHQLLITLPYNVTIETDSVSLVSLQSNQSLKAKITTVSNKP